MLRKLMGLLVLVLLIIVAFNWKSLSFGGPPPAPTVIPGPSVVEAIQRQGNLQTVTMTITNPAIEVSQPGGVLGSCDASVTYLAINRVSAGIDLRAIGTTDVITSGADPRLTETTITLPPATILSNELDVNTSRLLEDDGGVFNRMNFCGLKEEELLVLAQQAAVTQAEEAAIERSILQLAEQQAASELRALLTSFGYQNITIRYSDGRIERANEAKPAPPATDLNIIIE